MGDSSISFGARIVLNPQHMDLTGALRVGTTRAPGTTLVSLASSRRSRAAAFTLTELLVVIAILTLLAATQLPALTGGKTPVGFTQCLNNLRQIGQATMLYKSDNNDFFPTDDGHTLTSMGLVADSRFWPRKLLGYMGGYSTNVQPTAYFCPNEQAVVPNAPFQLHYQANRDMISDTNDYPNGTRGSAVRKPAIYWMIMDKNPSHYATIRTGALITDYLMNWNSTTGLGSGMRRHNGGLTAAAADGHVEWLRMHPYQPGRPAPLDFLELGDCSTPPNSQNYAPYWSVNNPRAKLFCRDRVGGTF